MVNPTYSELLRDPRWQRKRLEILQRDNFSCQWCKATDRELNVHHSFYVKDREPWDYEDSGLNTLCTICHDDFENDRKLIQLYLSAAPLKHMKRLLGYVMASAIERDEDQNIPYSCQLWCVQGVGDWYGVDGEVIWGVTQDFHGLTHTFISAAISSNANAEVIENELA